jgi:hypothetical protein
MAAVADLEEFRNITEILCAPSAFTETQCSALSQHIFFKTA